MAKSAPNSVARPDQTSRIAHLNGDRLFRLLIILAVFLLGCASLPAQPRFVPGQILVKPRAGLLESNLEVKLRKHGALRRRTLHAPNLRILNVPEEKAESVLARLRLDPDIEFVERDHLAKAAFVPNDPYVQEGSEWHLAQVLAPQAWDITSGRTNVIVAVLDSGVNEAHPELAAPLLPGYDFVNNNSDPVDDFGHGTAVSGVIAAGGNNGLGVAGVAYGARLLPIKVMNSSGYASYSSIAQGIRYAVDQGARIINISIAGDSPSATLQEAIDYAWSNNAVIVAAAGNNGNIVPQYPAACDHVVAVSATAADDVLAWFSSYGDNVTVSAPGDTIWTTQRDLNNPYGAWRGTSFSSPIVAGVAALIASENPFLSNTQIVSLLAGSADDVGIAGYDISFGHGRVNAYQAVTAASLEPGGLTPNENPLPSVSLSSPADGMQFALGATVTLVANVTGQAGSGAITQIQFLANGAQLVSLDASASAWDWTPEHPGNYGLSAVVTDDRGLCATSAPVLIEILSRESQLPLIRITQGPPNRSRLHDPLVWLAGTVDDIAGIDRVEVQLNGRPHQIAAGTTEWSAHVLLAPGKNVVLVRSIDKAGTVSSSITRVLTYVVRLPVIARSTGLGKIMPDLDGKLLEIGRRYTVKATPGRGQAFAGWTGMTLQSPVLSFVMQSNLVIEANFVPSPFPTVKGNYAGLMVNTNGVLPENSGYFRLAITSSGLFTGRLFVAGKSHGFRGGFDSRGHAAASVKRGRRSPLALRLQADLTGGSDQVAGSVADGGWSSELSGDRNVFDARTNPALQVGSRAFVLEEATEPSLQAAAGISSISKGGRARVKGKLNDGRGFLAGSLLARNGDCPMYLSLSQGTEIVIGWLNFPATPALAANGTVLWIRSGTSAFATTLRATAVP